MQERVCNFLSRSCYSLFETVPRWYNKDQAIFCVLNIVSIYTTTTSQAWLRCKTCKTCELFSMIIYIITLCACILLLIIIFSFVVDPFDNRKHNLHTEHYCPLHNGGQLTRNRFNKIRLTISSVTADSPCSEYVLLLEPV